MYIQLVELHKGDNVFFTGANCLENYLKKPEVWEMKGKDAETSQFEYLEIGQAKDIGSELKCDLKLLMLDYSTANLEIKYVARRLSHRIESHLMCVCVIKTEQLQNIEQSLIYSLKLLLS